MKNLSSFSLSLSAVMILLAANLQAQTDTLTFLQILNDNVLGIYQRWHSKDDLIHEFYQVKDRGRGDSLVVEYRENEKGFLTQLKITGNDYLKNPVEETFELKDGLAKWKNDAENDQKLLDKDAFYMSLSGYGGSWVKVLTKNNNKVNLIPSGQLELKTIRTHSIFVDGKEKKLTLYAVSGLGLTPNYGWMDEEQTEFATVGNGYAMIRKGYEPFKAELLKVQEVEEEKFYLDLGTKNVQAPENLIIKNVTCFDAKLAKLNPNVHVWIKNGKIEALSVKPIAVPAQTQVIEGKGMVLLPGLIDMHVHLSDNLSALQHLVCGVTGVRDLGNSFAILDLKKKIDQGVILGPTYEVMAGLIDGKGEYAVGLTPAQAGSLEEAKAWVDTFYQKGYAQIKLYSSIKPEWVPEIVAKAKKLGMRVSGHIPAFMTAEQAIHAGYNEIQHMNMLFLNFWGDTLDTRTPLRLSFPAKNAAKLDLSSKKVQDFIQLLKAKNITVDPTLGVSEGMFTSRKGTIPSAYSSLFHRLPFGWQRFLKSGGGLPVPEGYDSIYLQSFDAFMKMTKILFDAKIPIVAGTDDWAGFSMHRELELYVKAGIPANEVLKIATYQAAKTLGKTAEIGSIEKGKRANLVLIDGNPLNNISDIRKVKLVIKDGKIYDVANLLKSISIKNYDYVEK